MTIRALVLALIALSMFAAVQSFRLAAEQRQHALTRAAHAERLAELERAAREAQQRARDEEQRRAKALEGVIHEAESKLARARADAVAAATAGERLRERIAALTGACRASAGHPAAADSGAPADATADLLALVQRRLDEAADRIARHADESRAAGLACQHSYGALTP